MMHFQALTPLKIAFIGGGCNSAVGYAHYCASHLDGACQLVAGAFSRDERINAISARQYAVPPKAVFADWRELIAQSKRHLDALVVLTPTPSHEEIVCAALQAGLSVICEKSLTQDVESALRIEQVAKKSSAKLLVSYNYSAYPMVRELRARIASGQLGKIRHLQVEMPQEGFVRLQEGGKRPSPQQWRLVDGAIPTIHLDLTTHLHHLVYFLTAKHPDQVFADHNSFGWFDTVIDDATAVVKYEDDITCRYWVSKASLGYKNGLSIRVAGDLGSASWVQGIPEELNLNFVDGRREIVERGSPCLVGNNLEYNRFKAGHPAGFIEAFANLYRDFASALRYPESKQGVDVLRDYGLAPALEGLQLMQAMSQSHQNKQWIQLVDTSLASINGQENYVQHYGTVVSR